jgi:hypothetical protein
MNAAVWEHCSPLLATVSAHATKFITLISLSLLVSYQLSGWRGMDWIDLAQDNDRWRALVNMAMNFRVPLNVWKFLSNYATGGFLRRDHLHGVTVILTRAPKPRFENIFSPCFWNEI